MNELEDVNPIKIKKILTHDYFQSKTLKNGSLTERFGAAPASGRKLQVIQSNVYVPVKLTGKSDHGVTLADIR